MNRDEEIKRFQQLIEYGVSSGDDVSAKLQQQRKQLVAAGLTDEEINNIVHDRHSRRGAYTPRTAGTETPLKVPFSDKDRAKALGARWSPNRKIWVVPAGQDLNKFKAWL